MLMKSKITAKISCLGLAILFLASIILLALADNADAERRRSRRSSNSNLRICLTNNEGKTRDMAIYHDVTTAGVLKIQVAEWKNVPNGTQKCYTSSGEIIWWPASKKPDDFTYKLGNSWSKKSCSISLTGTHEEQSTWSDPGGCYYK